MGTGGMSATGSWGYTDKYEAGHLTQAHLYMQSGVFSLVAELVSEHNVQFYYEMKLYSGTFRLKC